MKPSRGHQAALRKASTSIFFDKANRSQTPGRQASQAKHIFVQAISLTACPSGLILQPHARRSPLRPPHVTAIGPARRENNRFVILRHPMRMPEGPQRKSYPEKFIRWNLFVFSLAKNLNGGPCHLPSRSCPQAPVTSAPRNTATQNAARLRQYPP